MNTTIGQAPGCGAPVPTSSTRPDKDFAALQAYAALNSVMLHKLDDDRGQTIFIVSRWSMTREMRTLEEVATWLDRVTGKSV
jgi:hypothetical protein